MIKNKIVFYKHQRAAFSFCKKVTHPALYMEMRLGKTLVTIRSCKDNFLNIVFAPSSALEGWEKDLSSEGHTFINLSGVSTKKKYEAIEDISTSLLLSPLWLLINKEACLTVGNALLKINWDNVILDEAHFIKSPRTKTTKFFLKNFKSSRRWCLTGTPNAKGVEDMVCLELFRNRTCMQRSDYWSWERSYTHPHPMGFGRVLNKGISKRLLEEVKRSAFTLTRKNAGISIKEIKEKRKLTFPANFKKMYDKVESDFELDYSGTVKNTIWNGQKRVWLRRLCSGFVDKEFVGRFKTDELSYLLTTELKDLQVVVWFQYNDEIEAVKDCLQKIKIKCNSITGTDSPSSRKTICEDFRNKKFTVLLLQQAVAQTGLNLSCADTAIYFSLPDGLIAYKQTKDRIVSIEKKGVLIIYLIVSGTIEEDLYMGLVTSNLRSQKELDVLLQERYFQRMGIEYGQTKVARRC